ncbi:MAG: AraC family transcriptional regulator [Polyangiales bacterium]
MNRPPRLSPAALRTGSINSVRLCVMAAAHAGLDAVEAAALTGIDPERLADPEGRVLLERSYLVWDLTAERLGDPHFGLHAAESFHAMLFDAYDFATSSATTLRHGIESMQQHLPVQHEGASLDLRVARKEARVTVRFHPEDRVSRQFTECCVALWMLRARALLARPFRPRQVCFRHGAPADVTVHRRVLDTAPVFSAAEDSVVFDASVLDAPLRTANPPLQRILSSYLGARGEAAPSEQPLEARVRAEITDVLRGATPTVTAVAARLGVSVRSLQRALGDAGTSFQALLDEARRELAVAWVSDPARPFKEVAMSLRFGQSTAFTRAFRRWTGRSPSAYRAEVARRGAPP